MICSYRHKSRLANLGDAHDRDRRDLSVDVQPVLGAGRRQRALYRRGRSWATGLRHTFNGQFVSISPPGWPLLMAAAMKISPTFGLLKLITIACMTFTMGFWYWFLIRFTPPKNAALLTYVSADHFTCLFAFILDAQRCDVLPPYDGGDGGGVPDQRRQAAPDLANHSAVAALHRLQLVRWAGALQWIMVGGVLMAGQSLPLLWRFGEWQSELNKFRTGNGPRWRCRLGSPSARSRFCVMNFISPHRKPPMQDAGVTFDEQQTPEAKTVDIFNGKQSTKLTFTQEMTNACAIRGNGSAGCLARNAIRRRQRSEGIAEQPRLPSRLAHHRGAFCLRVDEPETLQWMWLAVFVYCAFLSQLAKPNAQYLVPVLPIILWGTIEGIRIVFTHYSA